MKVVMRQGINHLPSFDMTQTTKKMMCQTNKNTRTSRTLVHKRTKVIERQLLVGEVTANFCG
jgi:hypothetical protein